MEPKSTKTGQIGANIDQTSSPGRVRDGSGAPVGSRSVQGGALERSWVTLGLSWFSFGTNLGAKTEPKSIKYQSKTRSTFWTPRKSMFGWFCDHFWNKMEPSWHQNRSQNGAEAGTGELAADIAIRKQEYDFHELKPSEIEPTSEKTRSTTDNNFHHRLGNGFWSILVPFGCQSGAKVNQKPIINPIPKRYWQSKGQKQSLGGLLGVPWSFYADRRGVDAG
jgi:hypothetical protein